MLAKTTTTLLEGLVDRTDDEAWRAFDARYRPIIVGFARRLGLREEDAADAAQETLVRFVKEYRAGRYDRGRGRLRSWIIGMAKHCIADLLRRRVARREQRGISAVVDWPDEDQLARLWEAESQQAVLACGLRDLRTQTKIDPRTLQAFELLALDGRTPADVAQAMGMTRNDVYLAKHRCLTRLREVLATLTEAYELG